MHLCLIDRECWQDHWRYGMPMRLYWSSHPVRFVGVWPLNGLMHWWRWRGAEAVDIVPAPCGTCRGASYRGPGWVPCDGSNHPDGEPCGDPEIRGYDGPYMRCPECAG